VLLNKLYIFCLTQLKFILIASYIYATRFGPFSGYHQASQYNNLIKKYFSPLPPPVHMDVEVPPPGCGRSVTKFWGWGAHRAKLRCLDDVSDNIYERGVPGGALNLNSTGYPAHGRYGNLPLQGKIPTEQPGIETGTSLLVVKSSHNEATRLVAYKEIYTEVKYNRPLVYSHRFLTI
jgi:hypothetical protein